MNPERIPFFDGISVLSRGDSRSWPKSLFKVDGKGYNEFDRLTKAQ